MPQWRKLHVKATESLDINDMPDDFTRLLWVMLPLGLDREGRGIDNPAWVKSKIMPLREDITVEMIEAAFKWYSERCMLERYEVNKRHYFWIPTFAHYQGKTDREAASNFPAPPAHEPVKEVPREAHDQQDDNSRVSHELVMSTLSLDSDSDSDANTESRGKTQTEKAEPKGAKAPGAHSAPTPARRDELRIELTEGGRTLQSSLEKAYKGMNKRIPVYYANAVQRDAYLEVFSRLDGKLEEMIFKGIQREITERNKLLSWLQGCARKSDPPPDSIIDMNELAKTDPEEWARIQLSGMRNDITDYVR